MIEPQLRLHLRQCAESYAGAKAISLSTLGRLAAGDWRFFEQVADDGRTFTARKYDEVIGWFSENWPADVEWPSDVQRPFPERAA